jgi:peptide/nickel transport system substrate-binding protein
MPGITRHRPFLTMSDEDWNLVLDVDLKGVFFCVQADQVACANISETAVDDPDQMFYENYACASDRNHTGFCDKEVGALIDRQSAEPNAEKRRQLVWEIEHRLARDASRPIIFYTRVATCWRPRVKDLNLVVNSVVNSWRLEDAWLDR